ncbi:SPOR domain-containing protein [Arenibacterium sp. CAU 1754]
MADIEYTPGVDTQDVHAGQGASAFGAAVNVLGAVASLALVAGIGVWGYKLMMRDVSGLPVVRAVEGPMRVQPENPGGRQADHQGLAVNAVAADGTAEAPADRLMLAPRPVDLTDEDKPMVELAKVEQADEAEPVVEQVAQVEPAPKETENTIDALVEQLVGDAEPLEDQEVQVQEVVTRVAGEIVQPKPLEPTNVQDLVKVTPAVLTGPGLPRSLRPQLRPKLALAKATPVTAPVAKAIDVDPASLPVGTRLAQLGAYESPEVARAEWDRLNARFEDYLDGKSRVIQKASSGGRTFYRLRAMGFEDINDARRFCSVLVAENADCIPVTTR